MRSVMVCDGCNDQLEMVPGLGLVCPNDCNGEPAGFAPSRRKPARPRLAIVEAAVPEPIAVDQVERWRPCGCPWSVDNYAIVREGPVTYAGCRACLLGTDQ